MSPPTASCCCRHALRSSRCRILKQRPIIQLRNASTSYAFSRRHTISARQSQQQWRWQSTESIAPAASSDNPKIASIVDQIGQLTLLETADLVQSLKTKLSIPDLPMGGFAPSGAAPPLGAASPASAAEAAAEEDDAAPAPAAKTLFTLKLESFDAAAKPKIIKEIKSMLGLSLVESKKFVESAPKVMKEAVPKEEAEKILKTLEGLGGKASME